MISDDGAESMSTKQAVAALVCQAFALRLITQVYPHHHQIKLYRITRTLYEFTKRPSDIEIKNNGFTLSFKHRS